MADTHAAPAHAEHHDAHPEPNYMGVFYILCACTVVSFITVTHFWRNNLGEQSGHMVVMLVAVIKALLVAMFFMHLKWDWFRVYGMMIPTLIMGTFLVLALLPDMTFSETRIRGDAPPEAARLLGEPAPVEQPPPPKKH